MADSKITGLTSFDSSNTPYWPPAPASDVIPIVDVSDNTMAASGTTKKISINNLLSSSPTAGGNFTITGDLTVATNKLKVTGGNVGIGTASPNNYANYTTLTINGTNGGEIDLTDGGTLRGQLFSESTGLTLAAVGGFIKFGAGAGGLEQYRIASTGIFTWYDGAGGTRMTLNSTGLGVGTSPSYKLDINGTGRMRYVAGTGAGFYCDSLANPLRYFVGSVSGTENFGLYDGVAGAQRFTIDSSGNVGIGVTPSAWNSAYKALELGNNVGAWSATTGISDFNLNAYFNASSQWIFKTAAASTLYRQQAGEHRWFRSTNATPTAGGVITFDQSMTLDASGNLLVGCTSAGGYGAKQFISSDSGTTKWAVGPYSTATNFIISAVGGSGVYLVGTAATSWTSASDERLKDIIEPISNAVAKVGSLRAVIGKFKFDQNNTRKPFLIAQDLQSVLPEAVDASNPDQLGVAYTDVIPLLVAAIKELTAEVNALKNA